MSTDINTSAFEALLPAGRESAANLEARLALLFEQRNGSREASASLDRLLLQRIGQLTGHLEEVRGIQAELRKQLAKVMAPPWLVGVVIRMADTPMGPLAEVSHGGGRRLVHLGEEVNIDDLAAGRVVYLSHELNAVLGVAPDGLPEAGEIATVERVLDDGRIAVRDRDIQVLVHPADALRASAIGAGDTVRWSRELMLALEPVRAG